MNRVLKRARRTAGALKRRIFTTPEYTAWRRAVLIAEETPRFTPGTIRMVDYTLRYPDLLTFCPQWHDIFVERSLAFHTASRAPRIVDCGANIGLASLFFKREYPAARVTAFEADPTLAVLAAENLQANGAADVETVQAAVWTSTGEVEFRAEGGDSGSVASLAEQLPGTSIHVPARRLADVLSEGEVDLLKLDIEGAEAAVLEDAFPQLAGVRSMLLEIHEFYPARRRSPALLDLLSRAGFAYAVTHVTAVPWRQPPETGSSPFPHRSLTWVAAVSAWRPAP